MSVALSSSPSCSLPDFEPGKVDQEKLILFQLTADLQLVQTRLGTSQEQPEDCQRAQDLAHNVRNKLHVLQTLDSLGIIELPQRLKAMRPPVLNIAKTRVK